MFFIQCYAQKLNMLYKNGLDQSNYKILGPIIPPMRTYILLKRVAMVSFNV